MSLGLFFALLRAVALAAILAVVATTTTNKERPAMSKKGFPGKGLSNTETCSSKGHYGPPVNQSGGGNPARAATSHPKGASFPGKGLSGTQTTNHPPIKR